MAPRKKFSAENRGRTSPGVRRCAGFPCVRSPEIRAEDPDKVRRGRARRPGEKQSSQLRTSGRLDRSSAAAGTAQAPGRLVLVLGQWATLRTER